MSVEEFVGNSMSRCVEIIEQKLRRPVPEDFISEYRSRTKTALAEQLTSVDGIEIALDQIDLPMCVASSGDHEKMRTTLGLTNLLDWFEGQLFSVTEVSRGKPHPDIFLHAAAQMGADPECCAVVEDTVIGVTAGVSAGMKVFGFAKLSNPAKLAGLCSREVWDE